MRGERSPAVLSVSAAVLVHAETARELAACARECAHWRAVGGRGGSRLLALAEMLDAEAARALARDGARGVDPATPARRGSPREVDSRAAAAVLGCSPDGARWLARRGAVPARRVGTRWRFDLDGLRAHAGGR